MILRLAALGAAAAILCVPGRAARPAEGDAALKPTYLRDVMPILDAKCGGCHAEKNLGDVDLSGGLALDTYPALRRANVVAGGDPEKSEIIIRLREKDPDLRMPRDAPPLAEESIALIALWIREGAREGDAADARPRESPRPAARRVRPAAPLDLAIPLRPEALRKSVRFRVPEGAGAGSRPPPPRDRAEVRLRIAPLPPVSAVAFVPPAGAFGRDLLAAGGHGTVTIWDLARGEAVKALTAVEGTVHAIRFSPDGALLAAGGGRPAEAGKIALHDTATWEMRRTLGGHGEAVLGLAFSPDGGLLASAGFDRTARVWDVESGAEVFRVREHSDAVHGVAFLDGGRLLASGGADRSVKFTDLAQGNVVRSLSGHEKAVLAVAASADGKSLVSSGAEPAIRFWNAATGETARTARGHGGRVEEAAFSRDGKLLATAGSDRTLRVWQAANGAELKKLTASEWLYATDFDQDARRVAGGAWDGTLRIWDVQSGRLLAVLIQPPAAEDGPASWAAVVPAGYFAASADLWNDARLGFAGHPLEAPLAELKHLVAPDGAVARALAGEDLPSPFERERAF